MGGPMGSGANAGTNGVRPRGQDLVGSHGGRHDAGIDGCRHSKISTFLYNTPVQYR